ncbi:MAG: hypothetical protein JWN77_1119 [Frankiales bacterium]|jgi:phosphatidylglycerol lysyltransferase|nr:hypothetical protein [Frankiales bacterium]
MSSHRPHHTPALTVLHRRAKVRLLSSSVVGLTAVAALLAGLAPNVLGELFELSVAPRPASLLAGRAVLVQAGVVLLLTARLLARGSRGAWTLATVSSAAVVVAEVLRERLGLAGLLAGISLVLLVATRSAYRLRFSSGRRARRLYVPAAAMAGFAAFAISAYTELDALAGGSSSRVGQVLRTLVFAPGGINNEQPAVEAYVVGLRVGAALVVVALAWALRRDRSDLATGASAARVLAERHGRASTAPLLALPDNARLPLCDGQALAGLAVRNGVALSLGLPVAPEALEPQALVELVQHCEAAGWTPALLALDQRQRDIAIAQGFAAQKIGEEAFLDVGEFSTEGKRRSNVRHSVTRARKEGVVVLRYDQSCRTARRDSQLAAISAAWLADKGGPELGFTLGRFDLERLDEQEVYVALVALDTPQERVVGFVTWLPYADGSAAVLDLMRRGEHCPPGVMETLVVDSLADFAARGRTVASLGGVPLAATTERTDRTSQLMGWLYEHGDAVYAAKGLFRFKDKFDPRWEPMFLAYPSAADVPRIGLAALRAFLPKGAVRELLATHRPGRSTAEAPKPAAVTGT